MYIYYIGTRDSVRTGAAAAGPINIQLGRSLRRVRATCSTEESRRCRRRRRDDKSSTAETIYNGQHALPRRRSDSKGNLKKKKNPKKTYSICGV